MQSSNRTDKRSGKPKVGNWETGRAENKSSVSFELIPFSFASFATISHFDCTFYDLFSSSLSYLFGNRQILLFSSFSTFQRDAFFSRLTASTQKNVPSLSFVSFLFFFFFVNTILWRIDRIVKKIFCWINWSSIDWFRISEIPRNFPFHETTADFG